MSITPQSRSAWTKKLSRLVAAETAAREAVLTGIYEATSAGLTQADAAHAIGDKSSSSIAAKAAKGKAILEGRKRT